MKVRFASGLMHRAHCLGRALVKIDQFPIPQTSAVFMYGLTLELPVLDATNVGPTLAIDFSSGRDTNGPTGT